jgi:PleD family two-component response regulator
MDGFQVMESLKELETDGYLPVLAVTAEPTHKLRALRSGAKDFVSKPLDMAEVLIRVRNMVEVRLLHKKASNYAKLLEELALNDPLTGLANRRFLDDRMAMSLRNCYYRGAGPRHSGAEDHVVRQPLDHLLESRSGVDESMGF